MKFLIKILLITLALIKFSTNSFASSIEDISRITDEHIESIRGKPSSAYWLNRGTTFKDGMTVDQSINGIKNLISDVYNRVKTRKGNIEDLQQAYDDWWRNVIANEEIYNGANFNYCSLENEVWEWIFKKAFGGTLPLKCGEYTKILESSENGKKYSIKKDTAKYLQGMDLCTLFDKIQFPMQFTEGLTSQVQDVTLRSSGTIAQISSGGLINAGNTTCYLNSSIQALHAIPAFRNAVMGTSPEMMQGAFQTQKAALSELKKLFRDMENHGGASVSTDSFRGATSGSIGRSLGSYNRQQDADEFVRLLLEQLPTKVSNKLKGNLEQKIIRGTEVSFNPQEEFKSIPIQLKRSVAAGLKDFFSEARIERAIKKYQVVEFPQVLPIQLKRFISKTVKDSRPVEISETLKASDFGIQGGDRVMYRLRSAILHSGTLEGGHYIAMAKNTTNSNSWKVFNDSEVSDITITSPITKYRSFDPYVLFYERVEA